MLDCKQMTTALWTHRSSLEEWAGPVSRQLPPVASSASEIQLRCHHHRFITVAVYTCQFLQPSALKAQLSPCFYETVSEKGPSS